MALSKKLRTKTYTVYALVRLDWNPRLYDNFKCIADASDGQFEQNFEPSSLSIQWPVAPTFSFRQWLEAIE